MSGELYASLGLGLGDGKGDTRIDAGNAEPIGGVPLSDGVGVDTLGNCHGAGDDRRMMVWLLRKGGDDVGDPLLRWRHNTSRTSFSSAPPSSGGSVLLAMSSEMRSA